MKSAGPDAEPRHPGQPAPVNEERGRQGNGASVSEKPPRHFIAARVWRREPRNPTGRITLMARAATGTPDSPPSLQILIANETNERLDTITAVVEKLGHEIVARVLDVEAVAPLSRQHLPDVALVGLGLNSAHALNMIGAVVHEAACPVIAVLDTTDENYVTEAAKQGVFAFVVMNGDLGALRNTLDITLRRFAEFRNLQGAFGRRAIIEQAKGILMARNSIDADAAHQLLKTRSQQTGTRLIEVAQAVTDAHHALVML